MGNYGIIEVSNLYANRVLQHRWQYAKGLHTMITKYTTKQIILFWQKVNKEGHPKGCWEWTANTHKKGYGLVNIKGKTLRTHRVSWELHNGEIPDDLQVLHECDNPACINPDHLFLGTNLDNVRDRDAKGRQVSLKGEMASNSQLLDEQVIEIRRRYKPRSKHDSAAKLAIEFNVHPSTISAIINNRNWKQLAYD